MKANIIGGILLVFVGVSLALLSIPSLSANGVGGVVGVVSGVVVALSSIKPFLAARSARAQRTP